MSGHPYGWDGKTTVYTHRVVKRDGRLCIHRLETDEIVYRLPDELRPLVHDRSGLRALARRLDYQWFRPDEAIAEFEEVLQEAGNAPAIG